MMESLRIVERGEATPQDVDTAMKLGAGFPMGPFELADVSLFFPFFAFVYGHDPDRQDPVVLFY